MANNDWVKIRNKYINSTLSQAEIAKKYKVSVTAVKEKCRSEGWVELRKKQQTITAEKISQKTAEKLSDRESDNAVKAKEVTDQLLNAVIQASKELGFTELYNKRQIKRSKDLGQGEREEKTETKEYIERSECMVNMEKVQQIASALKNILEINVLLVGNGATEDDALDGLIEAIKEIK